MRNLMHKHSMQEKTVAFSSFVKVRLVVVIMEK